MKFNKIACSLSNLCLSALLIVTLTSCLSTNNSENNQSRVRVFLHLENLTNAITAQGDSLQITGLKFIHGRSAFLSEADTVYFKQNPNILSFQFASDTLKVLADGAISEGNFQRVRFAIEQAPSTVQSVDADFVEGDTLYSMVIEGEYQNTAFTFKSSSNFISTFELDTPLRAGDNSLAQYVFSANIESWFLDENGGLINPANPSAAETINNNIEGSFRLDDSELF